MGLGWSLTSRLGAQALLMLLVACSSPPPPAGEGMAKLGQPYQVAGRWYYPAYDPDYDLTGTASWYGAEFHGRRTANGELFDRDRLSAAHPTLPLPSIVRVTNLANRRSLEVRVNDRGPFAGERIIDLSQAAARSLGFEQAGIAPVRVEFVSLGSEWTTPPRPARTAASTGRTPGLASAAPVVPGATHASACTSGHFIQVGAFSEAQHAVQLARTLEALKIAPVEAQPPLIDPYARVRLGPLPDAAAVAATLDRLKGYGFANAFLVKPQQSAWQSC